MTEPRCPKCGRKKHRRLAEGTCWFPCCSVAYDPEDDGGDYSDRDPAARMMREERQVKRRRPAR